MAYSEFSNTCAKPGLRKVMRNTIQNKAFCLIDHHMAARESSPGNQGRSSQINRSSRAQKKPIRICFTETPLEGPQPGYPQSTAPPTIIRTSYKRIWRDKSNDRINYQKAIRLATYSCLPDLRLRFQSSLQRLLSYIRTKDLKPERQYPYALAIIQHCSSQKESFAWFLDPLKELFDGLPSKRKSSGRVSIFLAEAK
ncbi:uncharacterized protein BYT42DRAFT_634105 [Radiomyces spectabilis]|uniref:uncharacterized protein n=1 Tax=Radiomyces spectabilis TaxID=64574 RepID=UPI00221FEE8C|nr:uncharacterized protein BYT42DRAFT_634105 [Radiomyces spectabilis]KAI8381005.1 hypothetical protein BYT42DRAFT_634105 [Radiomyces spectabilis]